MGDGRLLSDFQRRTRRAGSCDQGSSFLPLSVHPCRVIWIMRLRKISFRRSGPADESEAYEGEASFPPVPGRRSTRAILVSFFPQRGGFRE